MSSMIKQAKPEAFGGTDLSYFSFLIWLSYIQIFVSFIFELIWNLYIFLEKHLFHLGFEIYQHSIAETLLSSTLNHPCQGSRRKGIFCGWGLGKNLIGGSSLCVAQPVEKSFSLRPKGNRLDLAIRRLLFSVWWEGWKLDSKTGLRWGFGGKQCGWSLKKKCEGKKRKGMAHNSTRGRTEKGFLF